MTRPFQGATGVTHPLLAESVTQFQAQAFKELLPAEGPVRTQIVGVEDPQRVEQAQRVKDFIQGYDTAFSAKETADYSAITTWGIFYPHEDKGPQIILLLCFKR